MKKELIFIFLSILFILSFIYLTFFQTGKIIEENKNYIEKSKIHEIKIEKFEYSPKELEINLGDIVIWTNLDDVQHTITSEDKKELASNLFGKNKQYSHKFNNQGEFNYYCIPHPSMRGKIIVQ